MARSQARLGKHRVRPGNDVLDAWLMSAALWAVMVVRLGPGILRYLALQALVGFILLEAVNYLEHYGMPRQTVGDPRPRALRALRARRSPVTRGTPTTGPPTCCRITATAQRPSRTSTRRYQALLDHDQVPVLPTGYAGMILLVLVPPAWSRVVDPLVLAHYGGDVRLADIAPHARERIIARYPVPARTSRVRDKADFVSMTAAECHVRDCQPSRR